MKCLEDETVCDVDETRGESLFIFENIHKRNVKRDKFI